MIRIAKTKEDVVAVANFMKRFEQATKHVKVNSEYAAESHWNLLQSGIGIIFMLEEDEKLIGGLGAVKFPDLNNGELTAVELFWFVDPEHRGKGLSLLDAYERWYESEGCAKGAMIHLVDSYPDALKRLYRIRGYKPTEEHYVRHL